MAGIPALNPDDVQIVVHTRGVEGEGNNSGKRVISSVFDCLVSCV